MRSRLGSKPHGRRAVIGFMVVMLGTLIFRGVDANAGSSLTITSQHDLVNINVKYPSLGSSPTTVAAGTLTGQIDNGAKFDAYCVDLYHVVKLGSSFIVDSLPIAQLGPPGGHGAGVGYLYDTIDPKIAAEPAGTTKIIDGAALQVALWKVEYDNGGPLATGSFTMQDSRDVSSIQHKVFARATEFLSLYNGSQSGDATWFRALEHPTDCAISYNQDMVGPCSNPPVVPTPEPSTLLTGGLGIVGLSAYGWRRKRRGKPLSRFSLDPTGA
jgi:hypothetical protein